jgi:hypothetical protein
MHLLHEIERRPEVPIRLSTAEITADRQALHHACAGTLMFAQRQVAHRVPWDDPFVSLEELNAALDSIALLAHKYYLAITGQKLTASEREPDPDWLRSFEVAWYRPRRQSRRQHRL